MLQVYNTYVGGANNYLRCLRQQGSNTFTLRAARQLAGFPSGCCSALALCTSRLLTARGAAARDRERLLLQLCCTPARSSIAARLLRRLLREPRSPASMHGTLLNWAHAATLQRAKETARGAIFPAPLHYADISAAALATGRSVSYTEMQRRAHAAGDTPPPYIALPPATHGSRRNALALRFGFATPAHALGTARHTPVSLGGPGCSGSLLALADDRRYLTVASFMLGDEALHRPPFALEPTPYAARFARHTCRACGAPEESLWHVVTECPAFTTWRANCQKSLQDLCTDLWNDGCAILAHAGRPTPATPEALSDFISDGIATAHERAFLLYWTLSATPWPASAAHTPPGNPSFPIVESLGALFDALSVRPGLLRSWASLWLSWSHTHICLLAHIFSYFPHAVPPAPPIVT